ncbi:MAG: ABC transporter ATP-binding protein [Nocardioidaceae bacterium]
MIRLEDVVVRFGSHRALDEVGVEVATGRVTGIVGPNGSGKTTLLRVMAGLQKLDEGAVHIDDVSWGARSRAPDNLSRSIALVAQHQDATGQLRVIESVMLGRIALRGPWARFTGEDWDVAAESLRQVGALHLVKRQIATLSGGERQRVSLARALTQGAPHLLLDEPTNHLDVRYQHELLDLVRDIDITTAVVLHELNLASRYCDSLVMLDQGRVVAAGDRHDVLDPDLVEKVYEIGAARHDWRDQPQLYVAPDRDSRR